MRGNQGNAARNSGRSCTLRGSTVSAALDSASSLRISSFARRTAFVCGWNVRWNDLSKTEQDTYIRRAENVLHAP